jgi:hypothetical protein
MFELVSELKKLAPSPAITEIIREAMAGEYHDYKNKKYVCGKVEAYNKLTTAGRFDTDKKRGKALIDLADQIKQGFYDEEADEDDKAEMRKGLPAEAHAIFGLEIVARGHHRNSSR